MIPLIFATYDVIIMQNWAPLQKRGEKKGSTIMNPFQIHAVCITKISVDMHFDMLLHVRSLLWAYFCLFIS